MADSRLYRVPDFERWNIPIPNAALEEFLVSDKCKEAVERIAIEVMRAYVGLLPESQPGQWAGSGKRTLKRGARVGMKLDSRLGTPRHTAWVLNKAVSYRKSVGQPYPRAIEYGNPATGAAGGHQLQRAAEMVAGKRVQEAARAVLGGMSGAGTAHHQARPALKRNEKVSFGNVTMQDRAAARQRMIEETRRRFQKKPK